MVHILYVCGFDAVLSQDARNEVLNLSNLGFFVHLGVFHALKFISQALIGQE